MKLEAVRWNWRSRASLWLALILGSGGAFWGQAAGYGGAKDAIVKTEWVAENNPLPYNDAPTLVETRIGDLLAAWAGGPSEGALNVNIVLCRFNGKKWLAPEFVADGNNEQKQICNPCWEPVLFQPEQAPLMLFYRIGRTPATWRGMLKTSTDNGKTWTEAKRLPSGILGPSHTKPVELPDEILLSGSSTRSAGWQVHMERGRQYGRLWEATDPLNNAMEFSAIEPVIFSWSTNRMQVLCRTKQGFLTEAWSDNQGLTWSRMRRTSLPNPNSALSGVMLRHGGALLFYNHSESAPTTLNVAYSKDGMTWSAALVLEDGGGEYTYPFAIQTADGLVHVVYACDHRRIKHVVIDPQKLKPRPILNGVWP